jgi:recombination protein RecA
MSELMDSINKARGKEAIMLGQNFHSNCQFISTGNREIDWALGGGVAMGRIIEIYGPESSGKTTFCLSVAAQFQKAGHDVAFVDVEHALDASYATKLGVDVNNMPISQPDNGEQALNITNDLIRSGLIKLVIVDSAAALLTEAELLGDIGDVHMGRQARLLSDGLKKLIISASNFDCTIIFTNQIRMKIGVMFGNPETTSGGQALKFYASQRIDTRKAKVIKDGETVIGQDTNIKVVKNKVAPPFREVEVALIYGEGYDNIGSLIELTEQKGILARAGAWYSYKGDNVAQGKENMKTLLKNDEKMRLELEKLLLAA